MVSKVVENTGEMVRARSMMYNAMVHTVLLYREESWVITEAMMKMLESFQHRIASKIMGKKDWLVGEEVWEWSP